jgi:toll-interacting protein
MSKPPSSVKKYSKTTPTVFVGDLKITVNHAKLVKNYGLTRMDPYCRIIVGHLTYETQTHRNGSTTPKWNQTISTQLSFGVKTFSVEVYKECTMAMDELIAWTNIKIPESVLDEQPFQNSYKLCGKNGVEGTIELVLSYNKLESVSIYDTKPTVEGETDVLPVVPEIPAVAVVQHIAPSTDAVLVDLQPQPRCQLTPLLMPVSIAALQSTTPELATPPNKTGNDVSLIDQIYALFPNIDKVVIKTVADANDGDKDMTVKSLEQMVT